MAQSYEFYIERADAAASAAEDAGLENVRERELRAEKTWRSLAEQARKAVVEREKVEAERAARREAEAAVAAEESEAY